MPRPFPELPDVPWKMPEKGGDFSENEVEK